MHTLRITEYSLENLEFFLGYYYYRYYIKYHNESIFLVCIKNWKLTIVNLKYGDYLMISDRSIGFITSSMFKELTDNVRNRKG